MREEGFAPFCPVQNWRTVGAGPTERDALRRREVECIVVDREGDVD